MTTERRNFSKLPTVLYSDGDVCVYRLWQCDTRVRVLNSIENWPEMARTVRARLATAHESLKNSKLLKDREQAVVIASAVERKVDDSDCSLAAKRISRTGKDTFTLMKGVEGGGGYGVGVGGDGGVVGGGNDGGGRSRVSIASLLFPTPLKYPSIDLPYSALNPVTATPTAASPGDLGPDGGDGTVVGDDDAAEFEITDVGGPHPPRGLPKPSNFKTIKALIEFLQLPPEGLTGHGIIDREWRWKEAGLFGQDTAWRFRNPSISQRISDYKKVYFKIQAVKREEIGRRKSPRRPLSDLEAADILDIEREAAGLEVSSWVQQQIVLSVVSTRETPIKRFRQS